MFQMECTELECLLHCHVLRNGRSPASLVFAEADVLASTIWNLTTCATRTRKQIPDSMVCVNSSKNGTKEKHSPNLRGIWILKSKAKEPHCCSLPEGGLPHSSGPFKVVGHDVISKLVGSTTKCLRIIHVLGGPIMWSEVTAPEDSHSKEAISLFTTFFEVRGQWRKQHFRCDQLKRALPLLVLA